MILEALKYVAQGGPAVALVLVVWLFIRYLCRMEKAFLDIIGNHMTHSTEATNGVKEALIKLENLLTGWLSGRKN